MTIGTPEPPLAPRGVAAWVPWVVTPLVAVMLSVSLDLVDLVAPEPLGGSAARFLPPEGHRSVTIAADSTETVSEHTRSIGVEGAFAAPLTITGALLARLGDEELQQAQWWRASRVSSAGDRATDLYRVSELGVAQVASWGGAVGFVFEPELLVLPAEVQPGDTWSDSGSALAGGVLTYSATSSAREATGPFTDTAGREIPLTGGCIGVESTIRIENPAEGFASELVEQIVWCPGRGPVWSSGTIDGQPVGQAEVRPGALVATTAPEQAVFSWRDTVSTASTLGPGRALELSITDPFFGSSEAGGQFWVAPDVTADGRLVTVNDRGDDVQVWRVEAGEAAVEWAGHPGGTVVAVGVAGDLVLATNSRRQVAAYDSSGRRIWTRSTDELVMIPPRAARQGATDIVVVARSGTVSMLAAASGEAVWSRSVGADARAAAVADDGTVLVGDERGRLTAVDGATGDRIWQRDVGLVDTVAVDTDAGLVVVQTEAGEAIGLDLGDGDERFSRVVTGIASGIAFGEGVVIALTDERSIGLDPGDGSVLWRSGGGEAVLGGGEVVAIVHRASIVFRATNDGEIVDDEPFDLDSVSSSAAAVAVGPTIVLVDSAGAMRAWEVR